MLPSPAQVILEAVRLSVDADIQGLRRLVACCPETLSLQLVLRLLLSYLPESLEPSRYTEFLQDLAAANISAIDEPGSPDWSQNDRSEEEARRQVRKLHLLPLSDPLLSDLSSLDAFTQFLLARAYRIDAETGSLPLVQELLEPFLDHSEYLRTWAVSTLLPLLRFDYEYYPHRVPPYSLDAFERLQGQTAVNALLSGAAQRSDRIQSSEIGRDLRGLVGPWICGENIRKRRKLNSTQENKSNQGSVDEIQTTIIDTPNLGWLHVNQWLLNLAIRDFSQSVRVVEQWDGPGDVDYGGWDSNSKVTDEAEVQATKLLYTQAALATIYATNDTSPQTFIGIYAILRRITQLINLHSLPDFENDTTSYPGDLSSALFDKVSWSHMSHENLLNDSNPITLPSNGSVGLAYSLLLSGRTLESMGHTLAYKKIANLSLFGSAIDQRIELGRVLYTLQASRLTDEKSWAEIRQKLLWLRCWNYASNAKQESYKGSPQGVFRHVDEVEFEVDILQAFLISTCYKLAIQTYCVQQDHHIPIDRVQKVVLDVALISYDSASNGNKTRGGAKKAFDILQSFWGSFPNSEAFRQTDALLSATHALSFYSLTLQHGVPFQPVNIRVHPDPISLIDKVLNQNPKSYTKLEDLLDIGRNLVKAGLVRSSPTDGEVGSLSEEHQIHLSERRIISMAIKAALAEDDFDTAYSYVVNRLSPSDSSRQGADDLKNAPEDNIAWQVAYQAGRTQTLYNNGHSELRRLEQKMELLSQALLLAPASAVEDVLVAWRRCEEEMNELLRKEIDEEKRWDNQGDRAIPGEFSGEDMAKVPQKPREPTRNAINEEAPMGLFDVARGAAAALSKTAFPLRSPRAMGSAQTASPKGQLSITSPATSPITAGSHGVSDVDREGRVRKRDMVSNMVTGGLASGIGWVLGAPPVRQE